jgi:hypothetical protein
MNGVRKVTHEKYHRLMSCTRSLPAGHQLQMWEPRRRAGAPDVVHITGDPVRLAEEALLAVKERHILHSQKDSDAWPRRTPALNCDIVESILDQLETYYDPTCTNFGIVNYFSMRSACLISNIWLKPARRRLYQFIKLCHLPPRRVKLFERSIQESPDLGLLVHFLSLGGNEDIINQLQLFPNVTALYIHTSKRHHIRSLLDLRNVVRFHMGSPVWVDEDWAQLSQQWPLLTHL